MATFSKVFQFIAIIVITCTVTSGDKFSECFCDHEDFTHTLPRIEQVHHPTHQFLDGFGRTRWFHGTNIVSKTFPFHPAVGGPDVCNHNMTDTPLCEDDLDYIEGLGINVVRLGVMWNGAEPERDVYNCTYFCVTHNIIQRLASRGIYTLVDVHQDVLAKQMCHHGVPDWFMKKDWIANESLRFPVPQLPEPFTTDENGIPDPWEQCWKIGADWFLSYLTYASADAFQKLYDNHDGLMDAFSDYWQKIAMEFKNYTSVLGYDLMNEPWAGNHWTNPALLIPGVADARNLEPVWQNCSAKIRNVDTETLVFFEGVTWDIRDGHTSVPGHDGTKTAMSYHYYAPPQIFGLQSHFQNRIADQDRLQTGGILTEFRMWAGETGENAEEIDRKLKDTLNNADRYMQSWMGWGYRSIISRDKGIARHYARTYAPAVAGFVKSMGFNEDTAHYYLTWTVNKTITAPTEIRFHKAFYYPDGHIVRITPKLFGTWTQVDDKHIHVRYMENAINGELITVEIQRGESESPTENPGDNGTNGIHNFASFFLTLTLIVFCIH